MKGRADKNNHPVKMLFQARECATRKVMSNVKMSNVTCKRGTLFNTSLTPDCIQTSSECATSNKRNPFHTDMENRNVVDVLCEDEHGKLIYKCTVKGRTKLAKYAGMKLWLEDKGATGMVRMLNGLHQFLEEDPQPLTKWIRTDMNNSVSVVNSYENCRN